MKILNCILTFVVVIITITTFIFVFSSQKERNELTQKISDLKAKNKVMKSENQILRMVLKRYKAKHSWDVEISAYTARPQETNDDPQNTTLMQKPVPGWTIAVSQDLKFLLGKRVYIPGHGVRLVNDLMNRRYETTIDILVGNVKQANEIGRTNGEMILIEPYANVKDILFAAK